jgi:hypothetical protein
VNATESLCHHDAFQRSSAATVVESGEAGVVLDRTD